MSENLGVIASVPSSVTLVSEQPPWVPFLCCSEQGAVADSFAEAYSFLNHSTHHYWESSAPAFTAEGTDLGQAHTVWFKPVSNSTDRAPSASPGCFFQCHQKSTEPWSKDWQESNNFLWIRTRTEHAQLISCGQGIIVKISFIYYSVEETIVLLM